MNMDHCYSVVLVDSASVVTRSGGGGGEGEGEEGRENEGEEEMETRRGTAMSAIYSLI